MDLAKLQQDVSLKDHCSYKIGGKAKFFYEAQDPYEIPLVVKSAKNDNLPCIVIGKGSNILFSEKGFKGMVVKNVSSNIEIKENKAQADSGTTLGVLVQKTLENDLSGLESLLGIPGTFGGAIYGNAGTPEAEIGDFIEEVEVYDPDADEIKTLKNLKFGYRTSDIKNTNLVILRATLALSQKEIDRTDLAKIMQERSYKQPKNYSAGSFFKNPSKDQPAGYLIDKAGLKGLKIGNAQISEKHANFIINLGGATQEEVIELARIAKERVKSKFEIDLEPEVQIIDEYGNRIKLLA